MGLPMFYHGKGGGWRRQFVGVSSPNFFHGLSVNMISDHIPLIENFSMTSHKLLLSCCKWSIAKWRAADQVSGMSRMSGASERK